MNRRHSKNLMNKFELAFSLCIILPRQCVEVFLLSAQREYAVISKFFIVHAEILELVGSLESKD